ncbi:hypothetical protein BDD12DRAFT_893131 [Trichophaea hybrida]|nr:hypothetical protein BDD12DRAFT_893131 [Trichophaea hybrida]
MSNPDSIKPQPQHWFVLIGVDFYMPGAGDPRLDAENRPVCFPSLRGCVQDVEQVPEYIISQLKVDPSQIYTLTSTGSENGSEPKEKTTDLPTYGNIVRLLESIAWEARAGDIVYIHYSGHVPPDIACGGQYLLDVEIAILFNAMTKKRLIVTVVLDCCHSGSITRSPGVPSCRGIERIDALISASHQRTAIPIPQDEPELVDYLKTTSGTAWREWTLAWVLTYNWLESLKLDGVNITHGMLEQRLTATATQEQSSHTPIFAGNKHRYLFSSDECQHVPTIAVTRVDGKNGVLAAGKAHAIYAIYPWNANSFSDSNSRPKVRVVKVHSVESTAELFELPHGDVPIEPSFQAVPLVPEFTVKIFSNFPDRIEQKMFDLLQAEIFQNPPDYPLELVYGPDRTACYHIRFDNDKFEHLNTSKEPVGKFPSSTNPKSFLRSLNHLARYEGIKELFPAEMEYHAVDPEDCITCKVELYQPESWEPGTPDPIDYLKAFITVKPTPLSCLELPPLNTVVGNRHARLVGAGRGDWVTAEIEVWNLSDESKTTLGDGDATEDDIGLECEFKIPGAWPKD